MTMRIAPAAHVAHGRGHSEVSCFLCEQTFVVNYAPDMSLSTRCQRLDANIPATTSSTPTSWRPGGRVGSRHPREGRRMNNEYARGSGHSIIGLAVFGRSALHAEAIGRC